MLESRESYACIYRCTGLLRQSPATSLGQQNQKAVYWSALGLLARDRANSGILGLPLATLSLLTSSNLVASLSQCNF